jgi:hypothetical protein
LDRLLGLLKLFVVVAGIAIVLGTGALVWVIVQRGAEAPGLPSAPAPGPTSPAEGELRADLPVPAGSVVIDLRLAGREVLLLLRAPDGVDYLALVDLATGRRLSLIRLVAESP